jgi:hypothetical protein
VKPQDRKYGERPKPVDLRAIPHTTPTIKTCPMYT